MNIVHARFTENGDSGWNGKAKAGDQTEKEVSVTPWYNKPWDFMLRWSDKTVAEQAVVYALQLANSSLVGYDQSQRNSLYRELKRNNWNIGNYLASNIATETDCSAFIYAVYSLLIPSIRSDSNAPTTSIMKEKFKEFGFKCFTASKYLDSDKYLRAGDILVKSGSHTVMAIGDVTTPTYGGIVKVEAEDYANHFDRSIAGSYKTTSDLNIRTGAGVDKKLLGCLPVNTEVKCFGYFSYSGNTKWYLVEAVVNKINEQYNKEFEYHYTGFVSSKYLKRV